MGFTFRRSISFGRGMRLNLSKGGASVSKRVGRLTASTRGNYSFRLMKGLSYRSRRR